MKVNYRVVLVRVVRIDRIIHIENIVVNDQDIVEMSLVQRMKVAVILEIDQEATQVIESHPDQWNVSILIYNGVKVYEDLPKALVPFKNHLWWKLVIQNIQAATI